MPGIYLTISSIYTNLFFVLQKICKVSFLVCNNIYFSYPRPQLCCIIINITIDLGAFSGALSSKELIRSEDCPGLSAPVDVKYQVPFQLVFGVDSLSS